MGKSFKRKGLFGTYIEHFDDDGNKIGESRVEKGILGESTVHTDADGKKIGESQQTEGILGSSTQHIDADGKKIGESQQTEGILGSSTQHIDADGREIGKSRTMKGIFGGEYIEHEGGGGYGGFSGGGGYAGSGSGGLSGGSPGIGESILGTIILWIIVYPLMLIVGLTIFRYSYRYFLGDFSLDHPFLFWFIFIGVPGYFIGKRIHRSIMKEKYKTMNNSQIVYHQKIARMVLRGAKAALILAGVSFAYFSFAQTHNHYKVGRLAKQAKYREHAEHQAMKRKERQARPQMAAHSPVPGVAPQATVVAPPSATPQKGTVESPQNAPPEEAKPQSGVAEIPANADSEQAKPRKPSRTNYVRKVFKGGQYSLDWQENGTWQFTVHDANGNLYQANLGVIESVDASRLFSRIPHQFAPLSREKSERLIAIAKNLSETISARRIRQEARRIRR